MFSSHRANFCANAVVLAVNIRNHFEKNRVQVDSLSLPGPQYKIPFDATSEDNSQSGVECTTRTDTPILGAHLAYQRENPSDIPGLPAVVYCQHMSEDDLNEVGAMMQTDINTLEHNCREDCSEWFVGDEDFKEEFIETTLLDEPPLEFEGILFSFVSSDIIH